MTFRPEWRPQRAHRVQDATESPHVRFRAVSASPVHLGTQETGCPDDRVREVVRGSQNLCNTKITKLDGVVAHHEDVRWFQIAVEDVAFVEVIEGHNNLCKDVENFVFAEALAGGIRRINTAVANRDRNLLYITFRLRGGSIPKFIREPTIIVQVIANKLIMDFENTLSLAGRCIQRLSCHPSQSRLIALSQVPWSH
jgi:hypothetical protein